MSQRWSIGATNNSTNEDALSHRYLLEVTGTIITITANVAKHVPEVSGKTTATSYLLH
jgi:hypothetical protein